MDLAYTSWTWRRNGGPDIARYPLHPPHNPVSFVPTNTTPQFSYATNAIACIPYPLTKLSMLFFYLRLAPHSTFRKVCIGTMSYIVLSSAVITMLLLFPCTPVRGGWDHDPALGAKCIDAGNFFYFYCSMNVVTDIMLMMIPIPILLRMQLPRRARYGLVGMFSAGILYESAPPPLLVCRVRLTRS